LCLLASKLAGSTDCFTAFARRFFGRLLVKSSSLHFAKNTLTLHLLLKYTKGLVDVVVANEYLQETFLSCCSSVQVTNGPCQKTQPSSAFRSTRNWGNLKALCFPAQQLSFAGSTSFRIPNIQE
jgi:hypothetical protein